MKRLLIAACIATFVLLGLASRPAFAYGETYVVQPGDTLFTIAARYGLSVNDLAVANGLSRGYWVYAGQQLIIPTSSPFLEPPTFNGPANPVIEPRFVNFAPPPAERIAPPGSYTVQPGDTLYSIAARYGINLADLQAANWLADPNAPIRAGQQLAIPASPIPSFLNQPALPAPPRWQTQNWTPYPEQPPAFYQPAPPYAYPGWSGRPNPASERWIDVDLSQQGLTAYEGRTPVFRTRISSGLPQYPTVVGDFSIYVKYESADMSGGAGDDEYFLPAVPYVMYFHGNYGLHGTYWHNNFGQPMSHGCVNLPTDAAQWLFNWAPIGTRVVTHY